MREELRDEDILAAARASSLNFRKRLFTPVVCTLCCVLGALRKDWSLRKIEDWLIGFSQGAKKPRDGKALSVARARLGGKFFAVLIALVGARFATKHARRWRGLRLLLVDGTTVRIERSRANSRAFGHTRCRAGVSARPCMRLVWLMCALTGVVTQVAAGPYLTSELALLAQALDAIEPRSLLIGDRLYCTYALFSQLSAKGCFGLFRLHQTRKVGCKDRCRFYDRVETWRRPGVSWTRLGRRILREAPELRVRVIRILVRRDGFKDQWITLCTTLLDAQKYPAAEISKLYGQRWQIETATRSLKQDHLARVVRATKPKGAASETISAILAYSLTRATMAQASEEPLRLSHTRCLELLLCACEAMRYAPAVALPSIFARLLEQMAATQTPHRPRKPQPYRIIHQPSKFPKLGNHRAPR